VVIGAQQVDAAVEPARALVDVVGGVRGEVGELTVGFDEDAPGFFWLAGQGGYGIQTAPAMGELASALARGLPVPTPMAALGVQAPALSPARLREDSPPRSWP